MSEAKENYINQFASGAPTSEGDYAADYADYPPAWKPEPSPPPPAIIETESGAKITNALNLPEPLVRAVTRHPHKHVQGRISVTELVQPPQLRKLTLDHKDEIIEDASDRIWSLLGTLLHGVLERNAKGLKDTIAEEELSTTVLGWQVVGHYDLSEMILEGEWLTDWKLTSVWAVKDGVKPEWEQQLNCYAELIRRAGRTVNQLQIVAIGRDWSKSKARYDKDYPQQQVKVFTVPLWSSEDASQFLEERVRLHQKAEKGKYPECSPDERWMRDNKWALMKKGQKKAVKLYAKKKDAEEHLLSMVKGTHFIEERPGESVRCEAYCAVSKFCRQFAKMKGEVKNAA